LGTRINRIKIVGKWKQIKSKFYDKWKEIKWATLWNIPFVKFWTN
jgi:hypothetical protein